MNKELRLGNIVVGGVVTLVYGEVIEVNGNPCSEIVFEPLTEDWLVKLGFIISDRGFLTYSIDTNHSKHTKEFKVSLNRARTTFTYLVANQYEICELEYVHQVQNLFHLIDASVGELTYKVMGKAQFSVPQLTKLTTYLEVVQTVCVDFNDTILDEDDLRFIGEVIVKNERIGNKLGKLLHILRKIPKDTKNTLIDYMLSKDILHNFGTK